MGLVLKKAKKLLGLFACLVYTNFPREYSLTAEQWAFNLKVRGSNPFTPKNFCFAFNMTFKIPTNHMTPYSKEVLRLRHPFHIVDMSPWPIIISGLLFSLAIGAIGFMHNNEGIGLFFISLLYIVLSAAGWFRDIIIESTFEGQPMRVFQLRMVVKAPGMYIPAVDLSSTASLDIPIR